jgi:DNA-3-methyladenine glycosylase II
MRLSELSKPQRATAPLAKGQRSRKPSQPQLGLSNRESKPYTLASDVDRSAEDLICERDSKLASIIHASTEKWSSEIQEDPIAGLIRIVIAQQISTKAAITVWHRVADRATLSDMILDHDAYRACGLPAHKAKCCVDVMKRAESIRLGLKERKDLNEVLQGISGIGPWTRSIFRIFILREIDVLPEGDAGLTKAIRQVYGPGRTVAEISDSWRPFRSVACWYLWRSLGNPPLG